MMDMPEKEYRRLARRHSDRPGHAIVGWYLVGMMLLGLMIWGLAA